GPRLGLLGKDLRRRRQRDRRRVPEFVQVERGQGAGAVEGRSADAPSSVNPRLDLEPIEIQLVAPERGRQPALGRRLSQSEVSPSGVAPPCCPTYPLGALVDRLHGRLEK